MRLRGLSSYNVIAARRKRLSFVAGKFHFDGLRVIAEVFSEQIKPAFVACVVLDSDRQLNGRAFQKIQIVERNAGVKELIVEENALFIHDDVFQNSELRGGYRPEFGGVFAAPSAEIAGGSEREDFFFIYKDGYIARPCVVVAVGFRADFERKHNLRKLPGDFGRRGGEVIRNEPLIEPQALGVHAFGREQPVEGALSCIAPAGEWYGCWPSWEIAFYGVAYALYYYYGDADGAKRFYPNMKKHFRFIIGKYLENGLIPYGQGDLNYPDVPFEVCPQELTSSLNFMKIAELLSELAAAFGEDGTEYAAAASSLKCNIREKYSGETSLTGMAGLTYFGVCDKTDEIVAYLEKHDYAMHCGMLGAKYLLGALGKSGKTDELLRLLTKTDYPSFGFWYASGMTTLSENFEMSASLNHHMYSYIVENAIRYFVGVILGKDRKSAIVEPSLPAGLSCAEYTFATESGLFRAVASRAENGNKTLRLTVPSGFSAEAFGKMYEKGEYVIGF